MLRRTFLELCKSGFRAWNRWKLLMPKFGDEPRPDKFPLAISDPWIYWFVILVGLVTIAKNHRKSGRDVRRSASILLENESAFVRTRRILSLTALGSLDDLFIDSISVFCFIFVTVWSVSVIVLRVHRCAERLYSIEEAWMTSRCNAFSRGENLSTEIFVALGTFHNRFVI